MRREDFSSFVKVINANDSSTWVPFVYLDNERFPFYIGDTEEEVKEAFKKKDSRKLVKSLSIGGSEYQGEGYYFYGAPAVIGVSESLYDELHGLFAIMWQGH